MPNACHLEDRKRAECIALLQLSATASYNCTAFWNSEYNICCLHYVSLIELCWKKVSDKRTSCFFV